MKSFKAIICVLIMCTLLTGCMNNTNLKDLIVVEGVGIDTTENDEIMLTAQSLNVAMSTGTQNPEGNMTVNTNEKVKSVIDAVSNLSKAVSRELFFGHNRIIILSRDICENKFFDIVDFLLRSEISRADVPIAMADGDAFTIIKNGEDNARVPVENTVNLVYDGQKSGSTVYVTTENLLNAYSDKTSDIYLPVLKERKDEDNSQLSGIAIFNGDRLAYILDEDEALGFILLSGKYNSCYVDFTDDKLGRISVKISSPRVDKSVEIIDNTVHFSAEIKGDIIINEIEKGVYSMLSEDDLERICALAENRVDELCAKVFVACQSHSSDCLRVGEYLARDNAEMYQSLSADWKNNFKRVTFGADSSFKLKKISDNTEYR